MVRRRAGYFTREWRKAKRAMRPDRVAARFISGGKHQSFGAIAKSPVRTRTVTTGKTRRTQYQAYRKRQRQQQAKERRAQQRQAAQAAAAARKSAAAARKNAPQAPRKRTPAPPIAVNPRTGKTITWRQAQKALREASERAERLAAGLPGDAPMNGARPRVGKVAARRMSAAPKRPPRSSDRSTRRAARSRKQPSVPAPVAPGKTLTGVYYAATCACQGTGRIVQYAPNGTPNGSISCPQHGRTGRGGRKFTSRRAVNDAGLPGLASWLAAKTKRGRGNLDKKQQRAVNRAAANLRHAGPATVCGGCDGGIVNRQLTEDLRSRMVAELGAGDDPPSLRKRRALARKAYPYDLHKACAGLGRVPSGKAGDWHERANLRKRHRLTPREKATGRVRRR